MEPRVFISYSYKDEAWKDRLVTQLTASGFVIDTWDVTKLRAAKYCYEIKRSIDQTSVVILLISADFLASVSNSSLAVQMLLEWRDKEGLVIIAVIVKPCAWNSVGWLAKSQVLPPDSMPLSLRDEKEVEVDLARIAEKVRYFVETVFAERSKTFVKEPQPSKGTGEVGIFISHDHSDGDFAELLKVKLEKAGIKAWVDLERLRVGEDWRREIDDAIKGASAVIVVMTPEARKSEYVTYEWAFAWGAGVRVIPIMLEPTQLHPRLESLQYMDFTNRRARPWDELFDELRK